MRIERLEIVPYALRFSKPYVTARGRLERRELLLLRLRADGLEGLGEAAPLALRGGASITEIATDLDQRCRPLLEEVELRGARSALVSACAASGACPQALAAVELALLDLEGKLDGEPAWRLLGAAVPRVVECNATLVAGSPESVAGEALAAVERGFRTLKLKVGMEGDVEQVEAVRAAVGSGLRIRVDANGCWSAAEAVERLLRLEPLQLELAEQPAPDIAGMTKVRASVSIPVAADESVASAEDARRASAAGACDAATVKLAKVGGPAAALEVAAELPVYLSSALDGPVGIAGAVHVVQALPSAGDLAHGLATAELFDGTVGAAECEVVAGAIEPPTAPGLGVEIDEAALARYRLS